VLRKRNLSSGRAHIISGLKGAWDLRDKAGGEFVRVVAVKRGKKEDPSGGNECAEVTKGSQRTNKLRRKEKSTARRTAGRPDQRGKKRTGLFEMWIRRGSGGVFKFIGIRKEKRVRKACGKKKEPQGAVLNADSM